VSADELRARLVALEAEHAALRAELAAFQAAYRRTLDEPNARLRSVRERIAALLGDPAPPPPARPGAPAPVSGEELRALYRDAAKRMHPDRVADGPGRRHAEAFMKRLNTAHAAGDAAEIRDLLRQWETSPFAADGGSPATLRAAIEAALERLRELRASPGVKLMERWLQASLEGRDLLAELRQDTLAALADERARLAELLGREPARG